MRKNTLKIPQNNLWKIFSSVRPGRCLRRYWQQFARVSAAGRKKSGWTGLVAEAHFAEGWLEGDQSFILRTGPGRHTYGQCKFAVLPIVSGKTTIKAGFLPPFSLSVVVPFLLPGRCPVPARGRRKILHSHGLPAPWSNAPDRCERLTRPCTGKPPSPFSLSCPGSLGQTGRSPGLYAVTPPRFGPRQAGRWRCPGQQNTMIHTSPSSGIYQLSHVCNRCDHRELFLGERTTACRHFMAGRCHTSGKGSQLLCSCMLMMVPPVTTFNALSMLFKARTCSEQAP